MIRSYPAIPRSPVPWMAAAALGLLIVLAPVARTQRVIPTVELGGAVVRYGDSLNSSAATVSPAIRVDADQFTLGAGGTFSQSATGWSTQGALQTSLFTPAAGLLLGELSGSTAGSVHNNGARTGQALAVARAHVMGAQRGIWGGGGAGSTWDGGRWRSVRMAEAAAWSYFGAATALATVAPTAVADTIRYTDAEVALRFDLARAEIGVAGGARAGDRGLPAGGNSQAWGSVSATGWIAPQAALVASAGTYPIDFTQGNPGGRFVSVGLRFGPRTSHRVQTSSATTLATRGAATAPPAPVTAEGVVEVRVAAGPAGQRLIRVHASRATTVEIMGDFTNWTPVRLTEAGSGWWTIALPIGPGSHEMNVRAGGGPWIVPPGLVAVDDEFGGSVGILVVP